VVEQLLSVTKAKHGKERGEMQKSTAQPQTTKSATRQGSGEADMEVEGESNQYFYLHLLDFFATRSGADKLYYILTVMRLNKVS